MFVFWGWFLFCLGFVLRVFFVGCYGCVLVVYSVLFFMLNFWVFFFAMVGRGLAWCVFVFLLFLIVIWFGVEVLFVSGVCLFCCVVRLYVVRDFYISFWMYLFFRCSYIFWGA